MRYAIKTLKDKHEDALNQFTRVHALKNKNAKSKSYEGFDEGIEKDLALINDKITELRKAIEILEQLNERP